jgi:hypothetical protein
MNKFVVFNKGDHSIELSFMGYQYPDLTNASFDSNWLMIQLNLHTSDGDYECIEPALLTRDLESLINWFTNLQNHQSAHESVGFIEPNISFRQCGWINNELSLTITLQAEFIPPWIDKSLDEYKVDVSLSSDELDGVINSLRHQYKQFPKRSGW